MSMIRKAAMSALMAALGAAAAYLFDPDRGRSRRTQARDQLLARARRAGRELEKRARYTAGTTTGRFKQAASDVKPSKPAPNDVALVRKVESVIFRPEEAPKGRVSVNAEDGVIFLRGEVETQEQIDTLIHGAEGVDGVREVRSLLHLPGTPAPTDPLTQLEHETTARQG